MDCVPVIVVLNNAAVTGCSGVCRLSVP